MFSEQDPDQPKMIDFGDGLLVDDNQTYTEFGNVNIFFCCHNAK